MFYREDVFDEEVILKWNFYVFNCWQSFVGIKFDMLSKWKLSVEYEA